MTLVVVGDDWAKDHHDIEIETEAGELVKRRRLPESASGFNQLLELIWQYYPGLDLRHDKVIVGIEKGDGPWVHAMIAAGFEVYAINPLSASRYAERHGTSGAKSDKADAHRLAEIVRIDRAHHRQVAATSEQAQALKVLVRTHLKLVRDRTREINRLKAVLTQYFPSAEAAYGGLGIASDDVLELLVMAPTAAQATALTDEQFHSVLAAHGRRKIEVWISRIRAGLDEPVLAQPAKVVAALAATTVAYARVIVSLNEQITALGEEIDADFSAHPDAEIYLSFPGVAALTAARMLGEFGDDPDRFPNTRARINFSGVAPVTRQSGNSKKVRRRKATNRYLANACRSMAEHAAIASPGCKAYYNELRGRGIKHESALRHLAHRLVGILHACLRDRTEYNEITAWPKYHKPPTSAAA